MPVIIVGSVALDTVRTVAEEHTDLLGGSASYAAVAASFFTPSQLTSIVGSNFPDAHLAYFQSRGIDLEGLERTPGATARWSLEYSGEMNARGVRSATPNVFKHFTPQLPESYRKTPYVLLAKATPSMQAHALDQVVRPRFVALDVDDDASTHDKQPFADVLSRVNLLVIGEAALKRLSGEANLVKAASAIRTLGPNYIAVRKAEHGFLLIGDQAKRKLSGFSATPLLTVLDPTGADDCFVGGLTGRLVRENPPRVTFEHLRRAAVYGSVVASYKVEAFSVGRLRRLLSEDIEVRFKSFVHISRF